MKTHIFLLAMASLIVTGALSVSAQEAVAATGQPTAVNGPAVLNLAAGVAEVLQMSQAKVDEGTITTYIQHSGMHYSLNADSIIYLRQQGVSSAIINTMLTATTAIATTETAATTAVPAQPVAATDPVPAQAMATADTVAADVVPDTEVVQTVPVATPVYYPPTYYQPYYYPNAYCYPSYPVVSVGIGGWHGGRRVASAWRGPVVGTPRFSGGTHFSGGGTHFNGGGGHFSGGGHRR